MQISFCTPQQIQSLGAASAAGHITPKSHHWCRTCHQASPQRAVLVLDGLGSDAALALALHLEMDPGFGFTGPRVLGHGFSVKNAGANVL